MAQTTGRASVSDLAGKPAPREIVVDLVRLEREVYAESFVDQSHLDAIMAEARAIVDSALGSSA